MKVITNEQLEQVIEALTKTDYGGYPEYDLINKALTTLQELPELSPPFYMVNIPDTYRKGDTITFDNGFSTQPKEGATQIALYAIKETE